MPRTTMVVKCLMEIFKSTIRYRTDKKYRYLINGFSCLVFVIVIFIVLKINLHLWLSWFVVPVVFGIPLVTTMYLDHRLDKKNK